MPFARIGAASGAETDASWDDVKFLALNQAANLETNFSDSKGRHLIATVGGAVIATSTTFDRGVSSCAVQGSDDGFSIPNSSDFQPGTGPWSLEMFIRPNVLPSSGSNANLAGMWTGPSQLGYRFQILNTGGTYSLEFNYSTDGTTQETNISGNFAFSINTDYFVAVTIASSTVRLFAAAASETTASQVGTGSLTGSVNASTEPFKVGGGTGIGADFTGWFIGPRVTAVDRSNNSTSISIPTGLFPTLS